MNAMNTASTEITAEMNAAFLEAACRQLTASVNRRNRKSAFEVWLRRFVEEKEVTEVSIEVEGPSGTNLMTVAVVVDAILTAPKHEQAAIKNALVAIDFRNGNVVAYFSHLAQAIAL